MQRIIDNLSRQHKELVRTGTEMFGWLDPAKLRAKGASEVYRSLSSLSGILKVHLAMEDRSLYPHLVNHRDLQLRTMAQRFLDERSQIRDRYDEYKGRWSSAAAIEANAERFVEETRQILGMLHNRMKMEDDVLHPEIVRVVAAS
jgi:hemerythrin HHE cation binding domain-containing protein